METYKKRIDECTDLESLFLIWKEAHQEEKYFDETLPKNKDGEYPEDKKKFAKNWTNDGYLSDNTENIEVLFILKESNEQKAIKDKKYFDNKDFWIKENINSGKNIPRRMRRVATEWIGNGITEENWTRKAAVMNLNKRGGYRFCNQDQLLNYARIYRDFILRQIKIINPKVIVFMCGAANEKIINELKPDVQKIFYCYHPSYRRVDDTTYLNNITKYEK